MKPRLLILLVMLMNLSLSACAGEPQKKSSEKPLCAAWLTPDTAAYNKLGKRLSKVLYQPSRVKVYHLVGKEEIGKDEVEIEKNFVRDTLLCDLKNEEIAVLQFSLFSSSKSYLNDSIAVMSPYIPQLEFEFTSKKKEVAHVIISLSDMTWSVIYDDKKQFNFNYDNNELISRLCRYYMSNYKSNKK